jgi:hypothetical protein
MLEDWKFDRELRRLQCEQIRVSRRSQKSSLEARREKRIEMAEAIEGQEEFEFRLAQEEIDYFVTQFLTAKARSLLIPSPKSTSWETTNIIEHRVLVPEAIKTLRDEIHEEVKKRWERRFIWLTPCSVLIGMLTGLGGVAVGLLALWLGKK